MKHKSVLAGLYLVIWTAIYAATEVQHLQVWAYLFITTTITFVAALVLMRKGESLALVPLEHPVVFLSFNTFCLQLGWYNLVRYFTDEWDPAITDAALKRAAALALIANLCLCLGYFGAGLFAPRLRPPSIGSDRERSAGDPNQLLVWICFAIGLLTRLWSIRAGFMGYFSDPDIAHESLPYIEFVKFLDQFTVVAEVVVLCSQLRRTSPAWTSFGVMALIDLATLLLLGIKGLLLERLILFAMCYVLFRRRFPWHFAIAGFVIIPILFPLNEALRASFHAGEFRAGSIEGITKGYRSESETLGERPIGELVSDSFESMMMRSGELEACSLVIDYVDSYGIREYGAEYLSVFYTWIPRAFWPGKPSFNRGLWVTTEVYGRPINSSESPSIVGNLYLNFGTGGVIFGAMAIGFIARLVKVWMQQLGPSRFIAVVPFVGLQIALFHPDVGPHIAVIVRQAIFCFVLVTILVKPNMSAGVGKSQKPKLKRRVEAHSAS